MPSPARQKKIILILLSITALLWILGLLFLFRVSDFFHAVLMKKLLGPWIIYGAMAICPLLAMILSWRLSRNHDHRVLSRFATIAGALFLAAFIIVIGVPIGLKFFEEKTPKNPTTPRPLTPLTGIPVFPGAEGFGTRTPAGRAGKVIYVTSLADSGPGTLRAALNEPYPRIILFAVGGVIELKGQLFVNQPFVTVAGQSAPGDGICLKDSGIVVTTHDVLIQHLRVRPGNEGNIVPEDNDAIALLGKHGDITGASNVVLDHISASWGEDETISTWFGARDITLCWSIVREALNVSRHRKQTHSAGLLLGDSSDHVSMHHNLLAHNDFRNPLIAEGGTHDFANNVVYNWGVLPAEIIDYASNSFLNFIGNTYIPGPSTLSGPYEILIGREAGIPKLFVQGNRGPHRPNDSLDEWALVGIGYSGDRLAPLECQALASFPTSPLTTQDADTAYEDVLLNAGATAPRRDAVDQRIVMEVRNRTGAIINSPQDAGGYPTYTGAEAPLDSDGDGMPDAWETKMGFNANDPADGNQDQDGDGYTNVEAYLHALTLHDS